MPPASLFVSLSPSSPLHCSQSYSPVLHAAKLPSLYTSSASMSRLERKESRTSNSHSERGTCQNMPLLSRVEARSAKTREVLEMPETAASLAS